MYYAFFTLFFCFITQSKVQCVENQDVQGGIQEELQFEEVILESFSNSLDQPTTGREGSFCEPLASDITYTCACVNNTDAKNEGGPQQKACKDIICNVKKAGINMKLLYINLDRPSTKVQSTTFCNDFNRAMNFSDCPFSLLTIRDKPGQDLMCNVLESCFKPDAKVAFWLAISRKTVNLPWMYDVDKEVLTYEAWAEQATRDINRCATLNLASHKYRWETDVCDQAKYDFTGKFLMICECDFIG